MHGLILAYVTIGQLPGWLQPDVRVPDDLVHRDRGALYLIYSRPHRVPGHGPLRVSTAGRPGTVQPGSVPGPDAAQAAATAAGLSTAAGGGAMESVHEARRCPRCER